MPPRNQQSRAAVATRQEPPQQQASQALVAVTREIDNRLSIVQASAAAGINPDRLKLVALTVFTRTPALMSCEPVSVARAIVEAGQLGLEPTGLLGGAYLVPRGGKATLLVGYKGLVMLAMRSQLVQRVEARVVRARDVFEYGYGLEPYLRHVPSQEADPGDYTGAYAVIFYRDGSRQFDYMSIAEIEAIRQRSSAPTSGPWVTDYAEMCKKTPLRRLMKLAPLSVEVAQKLDELDPEVVEAPKATDGRQAQLRQELQAALEREYGTSPGAPRQVGPGNVEATAQPGTRDGGQAAAAEGAQSPAAAAKPAQEAAAGPTAAAPAAERQASEPTAVAEVLGVEPTPAAKACGIVHEGLGVGPCVLEAGHVPLEHQEAGGTRWSQKV